MKRLLPLLLLLFFPHISLAQDFLDVPLSYQYFDAIEYSKENQIVNGYSNGTFGPEKTINRAEFTKIIIGSVFESSDIENCDFKEGYFSDVSESDWFYPYICVAVEENIISGYSDGTFRPSQEISFVEAAKIIDIAFDGEEIVANPWYVPYVQNLSDFAVIPVEITKIEQQITRGQMTEMIWRWMEEVTDKNFMAYENGELISVDAGEVVFGVEAQSEEECYEGEVFDQQYSLCIVEDDADLQEAIASEFDNFENIDFSQQTENHDHAEEGIIIHYSITENSLKKKIEGQNLSVEEQKYLKNTLLHKKIWNEFNTLIPNHPAKKRIVEFVLFSGTGENEGTLAYVHQKDGQPEKWVLGINATENFYPDGTHRNPSDFYYTLLHEFSHVLTLNEDNTTGFESYCPTYEVETGCLKNSSVMGKLIEDFWKQSPYWSGFDVNDQDAGYNRYEQTPNRYVTDYAATNPGEDIAETFTHFVLYVQPPGNEIKDQKVLMFYEFPEMVSLRNAIRTALVKFENTPVRKRK